MKKTYKEILKREGGKRNLNAADVSEVVGHLVDAIITNNEMGAEFEKYLGKKITKHYGQKYKVFVTTQWQAPKGKKKK